MRKGERKDWSCSESFLNYILGNPAIHYLHMCRLPTSQQPARSVHIDFDWPHRQGGCLVCRRSMVRFPAEAAHADLYGPVKGGGN